jgi:ABC-type antimicrobial peptide transport system permease subunit
MFCNYLIFAPRDIVRHRLYSLINVVALAAGLACAIFNLQFVAIAIFIAWSVVCYCLHGGLQSFSYRVSLSPSFFFNAGMAGLLIGWATSFAHAWRVARTNPIHALRYE